MIFNSVTFLLFLAIVVPLYWALPTRPRLWLVFSASLAFYGFWRIEFIPVMLLSTVTDYLVALALSATTDPARRRRYLWLSLTVNLGLLFYFKYLIFFADNVTALSRLVGVDINAPGWSIVLPLGISFYTFQTISYTVDVYRGHIKAERDFVLYGCYVTFFPQLVAGPILRAGEVIHQLANRPTFRLDDLVTGVRRVLFGLFLKVVLADNIAPLVDSGFAMPPSTQSALDVWTLAFLFGYQIYFDFSAYSHIALGTARMMGIRFPENFRFPYLSASPREFWQRWHISLSSWIRDYLYLPLAGAQVQDRSQGGLGIATGGSVADRQRTKALFYTWALMGLWHGAAWRFLVWGLFHAVLVFGHRVVSRPAKRRKNTTMTLVAWGVTLSLTMLSWIPFRAANLRQAFEMTERVLDAGQYATLGMRENAYLVAALVLIAIFGAYFVEARLVPKLRTRALAAFPLEAVAYGVAVLLVFVFLRPIRQFIYFQF